MSKVVEAVFSDEAYDALINGDAVDNNGFRSNKGYFYPDQPSYRLKSEQDIRKENAVTDLKIIAGAYLVTKVILPNVQRFANEKVYPLIAEKWDSWRSRKNEKKAETEEASERFSGDATGTETDKVIKFKRKRA